ncbi:CGNR zinc finger domain-containing protein [Microbacterium sp. NPDC055903]
MIHAFPCGTPVLDFVGTRRARRNSRPTEMLDEPGALDAWFVEAELVDAAPGASTQDLDAAIALREAVYALMDDRRRGRQLDADAVAVLNEHAEELPIGVRLGGEVERSGSVPQGLSTLARQAIEILGGEDAALLRECARPECTQVYLDRSRGRRREWCAMKTCGNRVKASNFRARQRADAS